MSNASPSSAKDGPVTVYLTSGESETFHRMSYSDSGLIDFYNLYKPDENYTERRGDKAVSYPTHMIKRIEYEGYGLGE